MIYKRLIPIYASLVLSILMLLLIDSHLSSANDGAAEITPNGLSFRHEKDIVIEKEELYLSLERIEVSYVFKNTSAEDITTEIAFPIPEYAYESERGILPDFNDFTVEVNGKKISFKKEFRAFLDGTDVTDHLNAQKLSLRSYITCAIDPVPLSIAPEKGTIVSCFAPLGESNKKKLLALKIIDDYGWPRWTERVRYHWTQTFPARSSIIIKHAYRPVAGYGSFGPGKDATVIESLFQKACIDTKTKKLLEKDPWILASWVKYILTTANTWGGPIKKFRLIIENPEERNIVSLCFDQELTNTGPTRSEATIDKFAPNKDLEVYFIYRR